VGQRQEQTEQRERAGNFGVSGGTPGWSPYLGWGSVDAAADYAVDAAAGGAEPAAEVACQMETAARLNMHARVRNMKAGHSNLAIAIFLQILGSKLGYQLDLQQFTGCMHACVKVCRAWMWKRVWSLISVKIDVYCKLAKISVVFM